MLGQQRVGLRQILLSIDGLATRVYDVSRTGGDPGAAGVTDAGSALGTALTISSLAKTARVTLLRLDQLVGLEKEGK